MCWGSRPSAPTIVAAPAVEATPEPAPLPSPTPTTVESKTTQAERKAKAAAMTQYGMKSTIKTSPQGTGVDLSGKEQAGKKKLGE